MCVCESANTRTINETIPFLGVFICSFTFVLSACAAIIKDNNTLSAYNLKMRNRYVRTKCMAHRKNERKDETTFFHLTFNNFSILLCFHDAFFLLFCAITLLCFVFASFSVVIVVVVVV